MEVLFEQKCLVGRVCKFEGEYVVQFSAVDNKTIEMSFDSERDARIMFDTLMTKYVEALGLLQDAVISLA